MSDEEGRAAQLWLRDHWRELAEKFRFQWVMAGPEGFIAHSTEPGELDAQLRASELTWNDVALGYVDGQELETDPFGEGPVGRGGEPRNPAADHCREIPGQAHRRIPRRTGRKVSRVASRLVAYEASSYAEAGIPRATLALNGPGGPRGSVAHFSGVLIDTGAAHTQLPTEVAQAIGIDVAEAHPIEVWTSNGPTVRHLTFVAIQLMDARVAGVPACFAPGAVPLIGRSLLYRAYRAVGFDTGAWRRALHNRHQRIADLTRRRQQGNPAAARALTRLKLLYGTERRINSRLSTSKTFRI